VGGRKPTSRSRVTNGTELLPDVDGRSKWVRRLRDLIGLHLSDVGGEGAAISEAQKSLIRRAATLEVELERLEAEFARRGGAEIASLDLYQRTTGNLRRLLESLGLERRQRDVTPTLEQYLAGTKALPRLSGARRRSAPTATTTTPLRSGLRPGMSCDDPCDADGKPSS
jgi:hypothetical protein